MLKKRFLLASDLDGTLIPSQPSAAFFDGLEQLTRLYRSSREMTLFYLTGRHLDLALSGIERWKLPEPDILACDVGTSIYVKEKNVWKSDPAYQAGFGAGWESKMQALNSILLSEVPQLREQREEYQAPFKRSFRLPAEIEPEDVSEWIGYNLRRSGIEAQLIFSRDHETGKLLLDLVPPGADKLSALYYVCRRYGHQLTDVVYAGDSGNDLAVFISPYNSVAVDNTPPKIKQQVRDLIDKYPDRSDSIYFSSAKHIQGVLEGCRHFQFFRQPRSKNSSADGDSLHLM